ncbi:hypothetical protein J2Y91_000135 [Erwinia aphidicola]|nr:hypothetical protein [Erwinia aphidicola]
MSLHPLIHIASFTSSLNSRFRLNVLVLNQQPSKSTLMHFLNALATSGIDERVNK